MYVSVSTMCSSVTSSYEQIVTSYLFVICELRNEGDISDNMVEERKYLNLLMYIGICDSTSGFIFLRETTRRSALRHTERATCNATEALPPLGKINELSYTREKGYS